MHWDPYYTPGLSNDCGEPLCCRPPNPKGNITHRRPGFQCTGNTHACARVCTHACMHACTCTHTHTHTHTHTYACMHTRTHEHTHACTYTYTHIHTKMHACSHAHTCTHARTHTHTHTHTHTYTHTRTHTHTCIHTHTHVCDLRILKQCCQVSVFYRNFTDLSWLSSRTTPLGYKRTERGTPSQPCITSPFKQQTISQSCSHHFLLKYYQ